MGTTTLGMAPHNLDSDSLDDSATPYDTLMDRMRKDQKYPWVERRLDPNWANSYWQMGLPCAFTLGDWKRYLTEHDYYFKTSDKQARLQARAARCAKGRPSYDGHPAKKLQVLARDRDLSTLYLGHRANKEQLVKILEAADDEDDAAEQLRKFSKFLELPPELRNRVYTCYFQSLGRVPPRFVLPGLCRASRQLRSESTGLFFEHSTFVVSLRPEFGRTPGREKARLQFHSEIAKIIAPASTFSRIKHLHIELRNPPHQFLWGTWAIDLMNGQCESNYNYDAATREEDTGHVQKLVNSIMAREGPAKLEKRDLSMLEAAVSREYWPSIV